MTIEQFSASDWPPRLTVEIAPVLRLFTGENFYSSADAALDAITPAPVEIDYPALLDAPAPRLRAYPVETVVAEKFEALVTLGMANSRLKDFYDLWLIAQTFEFRQSVLVDAVRRTFERRGTALPADMPVGLTDEFAAARAAQWQTFLGRERMAAAPNAFADVIADLRTFLIPLAGTPEGEWTWLPRGPWSLSASSPDVVE